MEVTPSATALEHAARMGTRAGQAYRDSGVSERNPFDDQAAPLRDAWTRAYVAAAYTRQQ